MHPYAQGMDGNLTGVMFHTGYGYRLQLVQLPHQGHTIYLPAWRVALGPLLWVSYDPPTEKGVLSCQRNELNLHN